MDRSSICLDDSPAQALLILLGDLVGLSLVLLVAAQVRSGDEALGHGDRDEDDDQGAGHDLDESEAGLRVRADSPARGA